MSRKYFKDCLLLACLVLFVTNCTYLRSVTQTNLPAKRSKKVSARAYKLIFLGFNFDNDHVLDLPKKLQRQCPNGDVRGVLTKDARTIYFLGFVWAHDIEATGYCVSSSRAAVTKPEAVVSNDSRILMRGGER
tara:strand:- start:666 stop:1064 length:399 start_codon:yes stop_codon:yes gene_type:complete